LQAPLLRKQDNKNESRVTGNNNHGVCPAVLLAEGRAKSIGNMITNPVGQNRFFSCAHRKDNDSTFVDLRLSSAGTINLQPSIGWWLAFALSP
jgi:hypothetical protein